MGKKIHIDLSIALRGIAEILQRCQTSAHREGAILELFELAARLPSLPPHPRDEDISPDEMGARLVRWGARCEIAEQIANFLAQEEKKDIAGHLLRARTCFPETEYLWDDIEGPLDRSFHDLCQIAGVSDFVLRYFDQETKKKLLVDMNDQSQEAVLSAIVEDVFKHLVAIHTFHVPDSYQITDPELLKALEGLIHEKANVNQAVEAYIASYMRRCALLRVYPVDESGRLHPFASLESKEDDEEETGAVGAFFQMLAAREELLQESLVSLYRPLEVDFLTCDVE